ncbi:hypothetical protein PGB90_008127 [Kerria lacca]
MIWIIDNFVYCKYTALILARGGSKQIPKKNLAVVEKKTLLKRTIDVAKAAGIFEDVWVSTDNLDIYREAEFAGAKVFGRSEKSSSDIATSLEAVQEFSDFFSNLTAIALLQCTSIFQSTFYLRKAHYMMENLKYDSVFSAVRNFKLLWRRHLDKTYTPLNFNIKLRPRRQNISNEFAENGMFYWFRTKLLSSGILQGGKIGLVEIPLERSLEIDSYDNLKYAEFIAPKIIPFIEWENSVCLPEEEQWHNS